MIKGQSLAVFLLILLALLLRAVNFSFPPLNAEEARLSSRGFYLATTFKDELNRPLPFIFNSLEDYKLPSTSYLTALGILFFGKNDFGARIVFIIFGTSLVYVIYLLTKLISNNFLTSILAGWITATSPFLIFISRTPNQLVIVISLFCLLLYLLLKRSSFYPIFLVIIILVLTSKNAWFIIPVLIYGGTTLSHWNRQKKRILILFSIGVCFLSVATFLLFPQSKRSLLENNFTLFSDIGIQNSINSFRGQGIESGWGLLSKLFFNKLHFLLDGLLSWLSVFNPFIFFGKFDSVGIINFPLTSIFQNFLIIPLLTALSFILKDKNRLYNLLPFFLILTFPIFFNPEDDNIELTLLITPLVSIFIGFGIYKMGKYLGIAFMILALFSTAIILFSTPIYYKHFNEYRPNWFKKAVTKIDGINIPVAMSDDLTQDNVVFITWFGQDSRIKDFSKVNFPYKFSPYVTENVLLTDNKQTFRGCNDDEEYVLILSKRDLKKVNGLHSYVAPLIIRDDLDKEAAYIFKGPLCTDRIE